MGLLGAWNLNWKLYRYSLVIFHFILFILFISRSQGWLINIWAPCWAWTRVLPLCLCWLRVWTTAPLRKTWPPSTTTRWVGGSVQLHFSWSHIHHFSGLYSDTSVTCVLSGSNLRSVLEDCADEQNQTTPAYSGEWVWNLLAKGTFFFKHLAIS